MLKKKSESHVCRRFFSQIIFTTVLFLTCRHERLTPLGNRDQTSFPQFFNLVSRLCSSTRETFSSFAVIINSYSLVLTFMFLKHLCKLDILCCPCRRTQVRLRQDRHYFFSFSCNLSLLRDVLELASSLALYQLLLSSFCLIASPVFVY